MKTLLLSTVATSALIISVSILAFGAINAEPSRERQAQLREIVAQNCTVCHGPKLKGKIGPALTVKALGAKDEQMLVTTILEGRPDTVMPSWAFMLKENEARWLVKYLRSGNKK